MITRLEPEFMPMVKVINDFKAAVAKSENQPVVISVERNNGLMAVYKLDVDKENTGHDEENYDMVERIVKSLLWMRGGHKIIIAGSALIAEKLAKGEQECFLHHRLHNLLRSMW